MGDIITRCPEHGIINREPTPMSITYIGPYRPGQMAYCPYCGKRTAIEWPDEKEENSLKEFMNTRAKNILPWEK